MSGTYISKDLREKLSLNNTSEFSPRNSRPSSAHMSSGIRPSSAYSTNSNPSSPYRPSSASFSPTKFSPSSPYRDTSDSDFSNSEKSSPRYRRANNILTGYSGFVPTKNDDFHELDSPTHKMVIRGYSGHLPTRRDIVGEPAVPSSDRQFVQNHILGTSPSHTRLQYPLSSPQFLDLETEYISGRTSKSGNSNHHSSFSSPKTPCDTTSRFNFRSFGRHMDVRERYNSAIEQLQAKGQSRERLLAIVQSKLSEKVNSYANQHIQTRKMFEAFDLNNDGVLDEGEFRRCLEEKMNIQFDDVQLVALFSLFDDNYDGFIEWSNFSSKAMVYNPKGGTAVIPKMIISNTKTFQRDLEAAKFSNSINAHFCNL